MSTQSEDKSNQTVLTITVGLLLIYFFSRVEWLLITAILIGILGLSSTYLRQKIDFLWMKLAWILSLIVPNIILSIIFFGLLTPIAFIAKFFGDKDSLKIKPQEKSLYKIIDKEFEKKSFTHPW